MTLIDMCVKALKRHEGFSSKTYDDTQGVLTIGYGRNLESKGITELEATFLLENDVSEVISALEGLDFWPQLNDVRRSVLVNMAFNIGLHGLLGFHNMLDAIRGGFYNTASKQMLASKWASQVGHRAVELSEQMRTGESNELA